MRRISLTTRSSAASQPTGSNPESVRCSGPGQPVGVRALQVALDALGAQLALVEREVVPGLEADDRVVGDLELDPALLAAEAAVGVDDLVDLDVAVPASRAARG
jgi:hypothetical protein